jgi:hypothetical protein
MRSRAFPHPEVGACVDSIVAEIDKMMKASRGA